MKTFEVVYPEGTFNDFKADKVLVNADDFESATKKIKQHNPVFFKRITSFKEVTFIKTIQ